MKKVLQDFHDLLRQPKFQKNGYKTNSISVDKDGDSFSRTAGSHYDLFEIIMDSDQKEIAVRWISSYEGDSHRGDFPIFFTRFVPLDVDGDDIYII